uniref:Uncharacterized protein n=2 Tax=Taeniopygia guttata TaxID=59729 RepID=A0A674GNY0_TAEGU
MGRGTPYYFWGTPIAVGGPPLQSNKELGDPIKLWGGPHKAVGVTPANLEWRKSLGDPPKWGAGALWVPLLMGVGLLGTPKFGGGVRTPGPQSGFERPVAPPGGGTGCGERACAGAVWNRGPSVSFGPYRFLSALTGLFRPLPVSFGSSRFLSAFSDPFSVLPDLARPFPPPLGSFRLPSALSAAIRLFPPPFGSFRRRSALSAAAAMAGGRRSPPARCCRDRAALTGHCCPGPAAVPSVHQSLPEMDFERGIWAAARDGDEARVLQLLERRGDPAERDRAGYTALHYASRNGHLAVCRLLLERGAPSDARTPGGATPLHRACFCGHRAVTELLLRHGADPAAADSDGRTALHKAAEQGHRELCALLLRRQPGLAALRDARGRSPRDGAHPAVRDLLDA